MIFLGQLIASKLVLQQETRSSLAIKKYRSKKILKDTELHQLQRLLGLYTRAKYAQEAVATLAKLVAHTYPLKLRA